jgi:hypothetical protein
MPILIQILALIGGQAVGPVLGGLALSQWISLAEDAAALTPEIAQLLGGIHPAFGTLISSLEKGIEPAIVGQLVKDWVEHNQPPTMPGYGPDGTVIQIPNPDYK